MNYADMPQGIEGLDGRRPRGGVLTIGRKTPGRGFPEHRDRFYVTVDRANAQDVKPPHPMFERFNTAPVKYRQFIKGALVNATQERCFSHNFRCQSPRSVRRDQKPPGRMAYCMGNGIEAKRWGGKEYQAIPCPGRLCEFQQPEGPDGKHGKPCKPFATLFFELEIPSFEDPDSRAPKNDFPSITVSFSTKSWNTVSNLKGLFEEFDEQIENLGMDGASLFGFPFGLQLMETTNAKGRFPIVGVTPLVSVPQFLYAQRQQMTQIGAQPRYALTDRSMGDVDNDHNDYAAPGARVDEA